MESVCLGSGLCFSELPLLRRFPGQRDCVRRLSVTGVCAGGGGVVETSL